MAQSQPVTVIFSSCDHAVMDKIQMLLPNLAESLAESIYRCVGLPFWLHT